MLGKKRNSLAAVPGEPEPKRSDRMAPIFGSDPLPKGSWTDVNQELFVFTPDNIEHRDKIAGFDMGRHVWIGITP